MTIVDRPFAAELVSKKGKVFKFDAVECMVQYLHVVGEEDFALFLAKDYNAPDDWQDARQCTFLISEQLPSPMGAYLSAYGTKEAATLMQQSKGGEIFTWDQLKQKIRR